MTGCAFALVLTGTSTARESRSETPARAATAPGRPLLRQLDTLSGVGEVGAAGFGESIALSGDGTTALVGGDSDDQNLGAAWVFTQSGGSWAAQGSKLTEPSAAVLTPPVFGAAVALSGNGDTALIGAPDTDNVRGDAWVFSRTGATWSHTPVQLKGGGETGGGWFGSSVALSADGRVALVGGPLDDFGKGAAWVFTRSGSRWVQAGPELALAHAGIAGEGFGKSVALSSTGTVALVGAGDAAYVFVRSGGIWKQAGGALTGLGGAFGASVALSANGSTALVGDDSLTGAGSASIAVRSGKRWVQRTVLHGLGESGNGEFGASVALSASGTTALVGGPLDNSGDGAVWLFRDVAGHWLQHGDTLRAAHEEGDAQFGSEVALSSNGSTALVGGPLDANADGAAWVFGAASA